MHNNGLEHLLGRTVLWGGRRRGRIIDTRIDEVKTIHSLHGSFDMSRSSFVLVRFEDTGGGPWFRWPMRSLQLAEWETE